jgi:hypothetical protein
MNFRWREVTRSHGRGTLYLDIPPRPDRYAQNVGYIEQFGPRQFSACDMSATKWVWRNFDNLEDAKAWLLVCARMSHAS